MLGISRHTIVKQRAGGPHTNVTHDDRRHMIKLARRKLYVLRPCWPAAAAVPASRFLKAAYAPIAKRNWIWKRMTGSSASIPRKPRSALFRSAQAVLRRHHWLCRFNPKGSRPVSAAVRDGPRHPGCRRKCWRRDNLSSFRRQNGYPAGGPPASPVHGRAHPMRR